MTDRRLTRAPVLGVGTVLIGAWLLAATVPLSAAGGARNRPGATDAEDRSWPGTAEEPFWGPPPSGVRAGQLESIALLGVQPDVVVLISGDGEFAYASFQLDDPERFVIDLQGVVKVSLDTTLSISGGWVEQIRIAQFQSRPEPIARVVFDLSSRIEPAISSTARGLEVRFPGNAVDETDESVAVSRGPREDHKLTVHVLLAGIRGGNP